MTLSVASDRGRLYRKDTLLVLAIASMGELDYVVGLSRLGVERVLLRYLVGIDEENDREVW